VQGSSRLPVLLDAAFAGSGSLLSAGFIISAIRDGLFFAQDPGHFADEGCRVINWCFRFR